MSTDDKKNNDGDLHIPWVQVAKGDLIVLNGSWWKIKSVTPTFYKSGGGHELKVSPDWTSMIQLEIETVEGKVFHHHPSDAFEKVRVRPLARDPWEGRRREGRD